MARYGQKLLRQLTLQYCDRMGCSVGMREYIQSALPAFQQRHPDVQVVTVLRRNRFPLVKAEYALLPHSAQHLQQRLEVELVLEREKQREQKLQEQLQPLLKEEQRLSRKQQLTEDQQLMLAEVQQQLAELRQQAAQQQAQAQQQLQDRKVPSQRMNSNVIGVKSRSAADIREVVWWLTQSQCRPRTSRIPARHIVSKQRSIQGPWSATTF